MEFFKVLKEIAETILILWSIYKLFTTDQKNVKKALNGLYKSPVVDGLLIIATGLLCMLIMVWGTVLIETNIQYGISTKMLAFFALFVVTVNFFIRTYKLIEATIIPRETL
ncbi:MAG: hypothetical protein AAFZ89_05365 [Bacteroidota bacterium]